MENFEASRWLNYEVLSARKAADKVQLIRNYTYFGTTHNTKRDEIYYDIVIPTKAKNDIHWWRICIKPKFCGKRQEGVSKIDLETVIIDDNIFLPLGNGQSDWEKRVSNENAVVNTIPFFEDWTEVFEQLSDILDRMIAKKEGTELEESTKCKMNYESAVKMLKENEFTFTIDDFDFNDLKWMFNNYNFDYARSYGPERAYRNLLDKFREFNDGNIYGLVPESYAEWEEILGWSIDEEPPDNSWYN